MRKNRWTDTPESHEAEGLDAALHRVRDNSDLPGSEASRARDREDDLGATRTIDGPERRTPRPTSSPPNCFRFPRALRRWYACAKSQRLDWSRAQLGGSCGEPGRGQTPCPTPWMATALVMLGGGWRQPRARWTSLVGGKLSEAVTGCCA